jgi:murein L,D-transpeptidase YcbB/YkuD
MRVKTCDKKFASVVAIAGAVSLLYAPGWLQAAGQQREGGTTQGQYQEQGQASGQQNQQQQGMAQQLSSEQIRQVQQKLQEEGHSPGAIDGQWGPQTQAAVREFQQEKNLTVTGQLDQETLKELGVEAEAGDRGIMERMRPGQKESETGSGRDSGGIFGGGRSRE